MGPGRAELANLTGVTERRAGVALRRLVRLGLLELDPTGGNTPSTIPAPAEVEAAGMPEADCVPGRLGMVTIPRRVVRFLAKKVRPALIATALGVLLRCVSRRREGWGSRGRVKASWIAEVFGVDTRRVKAARAELIGLGWLAAEGTSRDQWSWNRWGRVYRVDLAWAAPKTSQTTSTPAVPTETPTGAAPGDCHPTPAVAGRELPPPDLDPTPLREERNPEPGPAGPPGVSIRGTGDGQKARADAMATEQSVKAKNVPGVAKTSGAETANKPLIHDIRPADLVAPERTLDLYRQAVRRGWIGPAEVDRFRFVAAAIHARSAGATNPSGLFRSIVQGRRWELLTQRDEDQARAALQLVASGSTQPPAPSRASSPPRGARVDPSPLANLLDRFRPSLARDRPGLLGQN